MALMNFLPLNRQPAWRGVSDPARFSNTQPFPIRYLKFGVMEQRIYRSGDYIFQMPAESLV
jgi:hypothetical protein